MKEDYIITQKKKAPIKVYFNTKTIVGISLILAAIYVLVIMNAFTPMIIYISGFILAITGLIFLVKGLKEINKKNNKIIKVKQDYY